MAFVNEIISEEDIQKYGLDELMGDFHPFDLDWGKGGRGRPEGFWYSWTIDRDRGIYFMIVKTIKEIGPSDRPEPTNKRIAVLNFQERRVPLIIERTHCPHSFSDNPFLLAWDLLEIDTSNVPEMSKKSVIAVLKEALTIYGYDGAYSKKIPNTVVEFSF
ncbi:hypothetical protein [Stenoxybacter acetivorans]|uniref:hypothetical protein n=1 Tax=Stenoxybacter acetivorans TaxID=422441 RepID=UPI0005692727|nr:hypothetical protein [Stenoxybacter acetivorans]